MAPNRRQVIIWINDGLIYWCIYAPLSLDQLKWCLLIVVCVWCQLKSANSFEILRTKRERVSSVQDFKSLYGLRNKPQKGDSVRFHSKTGFSSYGLSLVPFSALLASSAGNSPVSGEFSTQRPVTRSFAVFFDLRLNKRWLNNRDAGDLRRRRTHYDVTVMFQKDIMKFVNYHILVGDDPLSRLVCLFASWHGSVFHITGPLWGEPLVTGGWILLSKRASDAELWFFLHHSPE